VTRPITVLDAPSNLGLRPPVDGAVPGAYKLAGALRDQGIVPRLHARDAGVVVPPRYLSAWDGHSVRNSTAIAQYSRKLADRVQPLVNEGAFTVVLGGDCSILLGNMLALRRLGRFGLAFVDAHLDFRHPGNAPAVGAAAGEDLALVTGRGAPELTNLEGYSPYVRDTDVVTIGSRSNDEYASEARSVGMHVVDMKEITTRGVPEAGNQALYYLAPADIEGFWVHLDVDVLDSSVMPAVDSPEPNGIDFEDLTTLLRTLCASPKVAGLEVAIFDPDLDESGNLASRLTDALVAGLA